jgi:hypothetical protein
MTPHHSKQNRELFPTGNQQSYPCHPKVVRCVHQSVHVLMTRHGDSIFIDLGLPRKWIDWRNFLFLHYVCKRILVGCTLSGSSWEGVLLRQRRYQKASRTESQWHFWDSWLPSTDRPGTVYPSLHDGRRHRSDKSHTHTI